MKIEEALEHVQGQLRMAMNDDGTIFVAVADLVNLVMRCIEANKKHGEESRSYDELLMLLETINRPPEQVPDAPDFIH